MSSLSDLVASGNRSTSRQLIPAGKRKRYEIKCDYPGACISKAKQVCGGPYDVEEDSTDGAKSDMVDENAHETEQAQQNHDALQEVHEHDGSAPLKHKLVVKCGR